MRLDLLGVYGAGVLTFVTPCLLPLVPIYLAALLGGGSMGTGARGRLVARAALFALGFVAVFTVFGLTASSLGGLLARHRDLVRVIGAALVLVFGLKLLGVIRIGLLDRIVRLDDRRIETRFGGVNAVLMGVLFAAGWSPCVGPVLASVLTYASTAGSPVAGAGYLATYALGLATPLLLTAAFAEAAGRLVKRLRPWVPRIERAMGAALVLMALYTGVSSGLSLAGRAPADERATALLTRAPGGERQPVLVELYGESCAACRAMQPIIDGLKSECSAHGVVVRQVEIRQALGRSLVARHQVVGVPTFLVLDREGSLVRKLVGVQSEASLKDAVSGLATTPCRAARQTSPVEATTSCSAAPEQTLATPPTAGAAKAPSARCSQL